MVYSIVALPAEVKLKLHCYVHIFRFRRLAIRYNPKGTKDESFATIFALVAEAYDVLSDPLRRAIYDQFGEEGLKNGVPNAGGFIEPYVYHGEPMRTYRYSQGFAEK